MKRSACSGNVMYFVYAAAVGLIGYALWGYVHTYAPAVLQSPEKSFETHSFFKSPLAPRRAEAKRGAGGDAAAADHQNRQSSIEHSRVGELTTKPLFNTPSYIFSEDSSAR